ncbi:dihydroneopterin aldolase [Bacillus suaedaesalsae]|uniref:7,8-dihydroneopterin aldolase n=1 Tax=Bacillus suaedaesalsae TaxID=2810349 RepID=A0ABS2DEP2_9BACI|nr:dihydroneopterin aldolase [Bacillus suaedaesalsae]MBM6616078.1 dihydroneopterin aldolase [Bacillus suaedaesalsae]
MDKIELNEMLFYGYHGVLPEETKIGQRFNVSLSLSIDLSKAGKSDNLQDTVNYAEVYTLCRKIVEGEPKKLVEAVAESICEQVLATFPLIQECTIKLVKPDPPIPGYYKSVSIVLTRGRI